MRFLIFLGSFLINTLYAYSQFGTISFDEKATNTNTQNLKPKATFNYKLSKEKITVGEDLELIFTAKIDESWHLYGSDFDESNFNVKPGPTPTSIEWKELKDFKLVGKLRPIKPKTKVDEVWEGKLSYFEHDAEFRQTIKILVENPIIAGTVQFQTCQESGSCKQGEFEFAIGNEKLTVNSKQLPINGEQSTAISVQSSEKSKTDTTKTEIIAKINDTLTTKNAEKPNTQNLTPKTSKEEADFSLWLFFLKAFLFGLAALVTPCVFPMIPMTVSFFTHSSKTHAEAVRKAWIYGLSIIGIYTIIGTATAAVFGADAANFISTHWLPNLLFFGIFVFFAASFLGAFEIVLPSSLVNKIDAQSEKGGLTGVFFMAFTIVLVSFSCTGPIIGTVLIESAGGKFLKPIVGMLGFSMAFAIPFTLFAMFPSWLKSLPKSGGWLNSVKVTLGFLELAFALKFLSQVDLNFEYNYLSRPVFLSLWIVIFSFLGFYLLKKVKFSHDDSDYTEQSISVSRIMLSIATFSFVVYLIPGLFGAPLKTFAGYLPPISMTDFTLGSSTQNLKPNIQNPLCEAPKHADLFHFPHGMQGYFDLKQAQDCAKASNKPLFIDFTGKTCTNCRDMEANVWSDPKVMKRLKEDFVVVSLYMDSRVELPKKEWYVSPYDGKEKTTIGKQNTDLAIRIFGTNSQPLYVIADTDFNILLEPRGYDKDVNEYVAFLEEGKRRFGK